MGDKSPKKREKKKKAVEKAKAIPVMTSEKAPAQKTVK
jgi:hypothetical protein